MLPGRWGKVMKLFKYHVQLHTENRADIWKFSTAAISVCIFLLQKLEVIRGLVNQDS